MPKKVYLVDTENIGSAWVKLLELITKQDDLVLFYTEHSPAVSYQDLQRVLEYTDRFEFIHCYAGRNGLDFQLVTYLGYLLKSASKTDYVVVSNDMGFDTVVKFWTERDKRVTRLTATKINAEYNKLKKSESGVEDVSYVDVQEEKSSESKVISVSRTVRARSAGRSGRFKDKETSSEVNEKLDFSEESATEPTRCEPVSDSVSEKIKPSLRTTAKRNNSRKRSIDGEHKNTEEKPVVSENNDKVIEKRSRRSRSGKATITKQKNDDLKHEDDIAISDDAKLEVEENDTPSTFIYRALCDILPMEEIDWLYGMLCDNPMPETGLNVIYNQIIKHFSQEKGLQVYKKVKPNIGHFTELLKY